MIKDIPGYEGIYTIDEFGNIFNKDGIMHPYMTNKGYKCIVLCKNNIKKKFLVHRLVALVFVPNPNNYPIVLHLDNVKTNTHYTNLKWGTYSENNSQAILDGLNKIPRPDIRKEYILYTNQGNYKCNGSKEANKIIGCTESQFRNTLFRKKPIQGSNLYVKSIDVGCRVDVQRSSPDGRVEPQANGGRKILTEIFKYNFG